MADGIFTPAVSVTSAVGGIAVAKASVTTHIIPISIVRIIQPQFFVSDIICLAGSTYSALPVTEVRDRACWFLVRSGSVSSMTFPYVATSIHRESSQSRSYGSFCWRGLGSIISRFIQGSSVLSTPLVQFSVRSMHASASLCFHSHLPHLVFVRTKNYSLLAGILLAVTGCEAMFAK